MIRREFITFIGGAAAWPIAARAQQPATQRRIAIFHPAIPTTLLTETGGGSAWRAFFRELRRLGYVEGENLIIERYSAEGHHERYADLAREIVTRNPDVIVTGTNPVVNAFKAATSTIPVVPRRPRGAQSDGCELRGTRVYRSRRLDDVCSERGEVIQSTGRLLGRGDNPAGLVDGGTSIRRYADICRMRNQPSPSPGWLIKSHRVNVSVPAATSNRLRAIYPVCHSSWLETRSYREERVLCELLVNFLARSIFGFRSTNVLVATRLRVDPTSFACVARAKMQSPPIALPMFLVP
jgi:hypothetical protein